MKKGLMIYKTNSQLNIFNIGDYIQSLAASQFFNNDIDVYVNRESLDKYNGDKVKLIMNGWFMHQPKNWPPSFAIKPLFVAFHINKLVEKELTSDASIQYLKQHQPIGCRDYYTVNLLKSKGVDAYFSGCLTLTLGKSYKQPNDKRENSIYITDIPLIIDYSFTTIVSVLCLMFKEWRSIKKIYKKRHGEFSIKRFIKNLFFVEKYKRMFSLKLLEEAFYIQQEINDNFDSEQAKFNYAKELLNKYATAKFVITSRIHCALPCLALDTPVLYVYNKEQTEVSTCRMEGLLDLFHVVYVDKTSIETELTKELITQTFEFCNKNEFHQYRDALISKCEDFVKS